MAPGTRAPRPRASGRQLSAFASPPTEFRQRFAGEHPQNSPPAVAFDRRSTEATHTLTSSPTTLRSSERTPSLHPDPPRRPRFSRQAADSGGPPDLDKSLDRIRPGADPGRRKTDGRQTWRNFRRRRSRTPRWQARTGTRAWPRRPGRRRRATHPPPPPRPAPLRPPGARRTRPAMA